MAISPQPLATWRDLVGDAGYWRWTLVAQIARLSSFLATFAFVLAATDFLDRGSLGGLMVTSYILPSVIMAPLNGRLFDRYGPGRMLPLQQATCSAIVILLIVAIVNTWSSPLILALTTLLGIVAAGSGGALRALLNVEVKDRHVDRAMALDSLLVEIMVVGAPLLVVAATAIGDIGGIVAMACSFGLAAVFARTLLGKGSTPEPVRRDEAALPGGALLRNRRFLFWLLVSVAFGHSLGTVEIGSLAISHRLDSGSFEAAMLLAALAGASITGGLAYGTLAHRLRDRLVPLTAAFLAVVTVMVVLIALIQHWIPLVVSFLLLGLVVAPLSIIRQQATERETPVSQRTEAFATLFAGNALGFALAGLVLAVAPLTAAMALGASTSLLALVLIPLLVRTRDHRARMA